MEKENEKVLLVYADQRIDEEEIEETKELILACGMELEGIELQRLREVSFSTYIGKGKCAEISSTLSQQPVDLIIFHQMLTPLQSANLEALWGISVIDRSELIVEIFAQRAKSKEAKLQVECARLKKRLPRLIGSHTSLGRQSGGRNKGAGEKQLEIDRRRVKAKISELEKELRRIKGKREIQRKKRIRNKIPQAALVGYTNAGKSTLMNAILEVSDAMLGKEVLEKDQVFATLDTSIRRIQLKNKQEFLLSDTVGFLSKLPHELIQAFHSTLEEVCYADLLLVVIDASSPHASTQMEVTKQTLHDIHADHIPILFVYNKCDASSLPYPCASEHTHYISAKHREGIAELLTSIQAQLFEDVMDINLSIPYEDMHILSTLMRDLFVEKQENTDKTMEIQGKISKNAVKHYVKYVKF